MNNKATAVRVGDIGADSGMSTNMKVSSPFESLLSGLEDNRGLALSIRHQLYSLKDRIKGHEACSGDGQLKDECPSGILPNLLYVKDDEQKILREIEDICTELLELF